MIEVIEFRELRRNSLLGFAKIRVAEWHLVISDVAIYEKDGRKWAQLPSKQLLDKNSGEPLRDADGKPRYVRLLQFDDRTISDRFSDSVVRAVEAHQTNGE
jgi:hypothetical protein